MDSDYEVVWNGVNDGRGGDTLDPGLRATVLLDAPAATVTRQAPSGQRQGTPTAVLHQRVLTALAEGPLAYTRLRGACHVSCGAMTEALMQLGEGGLVERVAAGGFVTYRLAE